MALAGLDTAHKGVISGPPCYSCALQYPVVVLTKSYLDEHLANLAQFMADRKYFLFLYLKKGQFLNMISYPSKPTRRQRPKAVGGASERSERGRSALFKNPLFF